MCIWPLLCNLALLPKALDSLAFTWQSLWTPSMAKSWASLLFWYHHTVQAAHPSRNPCLAYKYQLPYFDHWIRDASWHWCATSALTLGALLSIEVNKTIVQWQEMQALIQGISFTCDKVWLLIGEDGSNCDAVTRHSLFGTEHINQLTCSIWPNWQKWLGPFLDWMNVAHFQVNNMGVDAFRFLAYHNVIASQISNQFPLSTGNKLKVLQLILHLSKPW